MANPLVSIVIPCYRQGRFLRYSIGSALDQSYSPAEIIVVNDGSDDDTEAVAQSYGDKVKYYWQPNSGVPASPRNAGLSRSSGKYVLFMDADDMLHRDALGWLVEAARGREDVFCLMGFKRFVNDPSVDGYSEKLPPTDGSLGPKLMLGNMGQPNGILCSRSMLNSIGGFCTDASVRGCEDWYTWLRIVFAGAEIVPIQRVGAFYREHPDSLSKNKAGMAAAHSEVLWRTYCWSLSNPRRVSDMGADLKAIHQEIARRLFGYAYNLRETGKYREAVRAFWHSFRAGGFQNPALSGIVKLFPHWMVHQLNPANRVAVGAKRWS